MAESANVEIVIQAFTEAAKQAVDEVGDELTSLSADAQPAQGAMDEVADELDDTTTSAAAAGSAMDSTRDDASGLAGAMAALANRADQAGDDLRETAYSSNIAGAAMTRLSLGTSGASVSVGILSTAITASLIPSLITLSTVLLPLTGLLGGVIAAAGSLAAVLGGLAAVGAVTHLEELKQAFEDVKPAIVDTLEPLGEVFGPLLVDAVRALPELTQRIVDALGPLDQFADSVREMGQMAMEVIPQLVAWMFDLAERAMPVLIEVIRDLQAVGPGLLDAVGRALERLGPVLGALKDALMDALPTLHDIGIAVGELVIPALTKFFDVLDAAGEFILSMEEDMRQLTLAGLITAPAILAVASSLGALLGPLGLAAAAVGAFVAMYRSNFMGIGDITDRVVGKLLTRARELAAIFQQHLQTLLGEVRDVASTFQAAFEGEASAALDAFLSNVQGYLDDVVELIRDVAAAAAPVIETIGSTLQDNAGHFATFAAMALGAMNGVVNVMRNVVLPAVRFVLLNFVIPLVQRLTDVWASNFGDILRETIQVMQGIRAAIQPVLTWLIAFWRKWGDEITTAVRFAFDIIIGVIGTALDAIYTTIMVVLHLLQGDFDEALAVIADFWVDTFLGILSFIEEWGIVDAIVDVVSGAIDAVRTFIFRDIPQLFVMGLAKLIGLVTNFGPSLINAFVGIFNRVIDLVAGAVNGLISMITDAINGILSTIDKVADEVSEIPGVDNVDLGRLNKATVDASRLKQDRVKSNRQQATQQAAQRLAATLEIDVQGDGPLADFVDQQAEAKVQQKDRQDTRRLRRQGATSN